MRLLWSTQVTPRRAPSGVSKRTSLEPSKWGVQTAPFRASVGRVSGKPRKPPPIDARRAAGERPSEAPPPFFFWPEQKPESQTDQNLWSKNGHRTISLISPECEPARILDSRGRFSTTIRGRFSTTHFHR